MKLGIRILKGPDGIPAPRLCDGWTGKPLPGQTSLRHCSDADGHRLQVTFRIDGRDVGWQLDSAATPPAHDD